MTSYQLFEQIFRFSSEASVGLLFHHLNDMSLPAKLQTNLLRTMKTATLKGGLSCRRNRHIEERDCREGGREEKWTRERSRCRRCSAATCFINALATDGPCTATREVRIHHSKLACCSCSNPIKHMDCTLNEGPRCWRAGLGIHRAQMSKGPLRMSCSFYICVHLDSPHCYGLPVWTSYNPFLWESQA